MCVAPDAAMIAISRSNSAATCACSPSSSTINTAAAAVGYPAWTAASAASIARRSMISIAPSSSPDSITRDTASPAACRLSYAASTVR